MLNLSLNSSVLIISNNQLHQTPEGSLLDMKNHGGAGEQNVSAPSEAWCILQGAS